MQTIIIIIITVTIIVSHVVDSLVCKIFVDYITFSLFRQFSIMISLLLQFYFNIWLFYVSVFYVFVGDRFDA